MNINFFYNLGKKELYPLCRSLTGDGNLKTLKIIKKVLRNLKIKSFKSNSKVFDWKIPSEWNIYDAYVIDKFGNKIIDFKKNNLHLVGYSKSIKKSVEKVELLKHIFSLPKQPQAIPYVTSYYKKYWGFCISEYQKRIIASKYKNNDNFKVVIKSNFNPKGKLLIGEYLIKGKSSKEILISTYICHPSLANDNLSGIIISMALIDHFKRFKNLKKSLRFVFLPETIGSIAYLSRNLKYLQKKIIGGYNLTCIGDEGKHSYILSKYQNSPSDKSLIEAYKTLKIKAIKYSFLQRGSDERQYNSPGIDLPITSIFKSKYGTFPEYHTSLDNFDLMTKNGVKDGFKIAKKAIEILLKKTFPISRILCEPQMSNKGLYPTISHKNIKNLNGNLLDFLQYSDGRNNLKEISNYIKLPLKKTEAIYKLLKKNKLIRY